MFSVKWEKQDIFMDAETEKISSVWFEIAVVFHI